MGYSPWGHKESDTTDRLILLLLPTVGGTSGKEPTCCGDQRDVGLIPRRREDPLEKGMATHLCILVWRIRWMQKHGGLQSMGSQRVGHN